MEMRNIFKSMDSTLNIEDAASARRISKGAHLLREKRSLEIWNLIKKNFLSLLLFEFTYRVGTFLLIMRVFRFGVSLSLKRHNFSYLTAENFIAFVSSPITLLFLALTGLLTLVFLVIEVSAVFVCLQYSSNNVKIDMTDMAILGVQKSLAFFKNSRTSWVISVFFSVPFLCLHFLVREIYYIKVLNYAAIAVYNLFTQKWLLFLAIGLIFIISLLCVFTLPYCLLEGRRSFRGMVGSIKLLARHAKETLGGLLVVNLMITVLLWLLYVAAVLLASLYVFLSKDASVAIGALLSIDEWIEMGIGIVGGAIGLVLNVAFIYRLYVKYVNERQSRKIPVVKNEIVAVSRSARRRIAGVLSVILILLEVVYLANFIMRSNRIGENIIESTRITAHRGVSISAPENTMLSLEKSVEAMVDYAEIDVQETMDGEVVLLHDNNLRRMTGVRANIWDVNYREIKDLLVIDRTRQENEDQTIPTLREVLEFSKGRLDLNIEIKYNGRNEGIVEKVVALVEEYEFTDQCVITSMNYDFIRRVKELNEDIQTGYIMEMTYGSIANITDADFFSVKWTYIGENFIREAHEQGKQVHAWTVNYRGAAEKMKTLNVDNIITDNPALVKEVLMEEERTTTYMELLRYVFN